MRAIHPTPQTCGTHAIASFPGWPGNCSPGTPPTHGAHQDHQVDGQDQLQLLCPLVSGHTKCSLRKYSVSME
eukprot:2629473-Alexandrium_andersonii.AAC.1